MGDLKSEILARKEKIYRNHSVKTKLHPTWHTALAFYEGNQWKKWSTKLRGMRDMKPLDITRKLTINKIEKIVTTFVAHFRKENPNCNVNPNSNTSDDVNAANLSQDVLKAEYIPKLEEVLTDYFYWKYIVGIGIRGLFWNPNASAKLKLPYYENGMMAGQEFREVPDVGQLYLKTINPFNFFPVGGSKIEDSTEILYVEYLPIQKIDQMFNFKATPEAFGADTMTGTYSRDYDENEYETFEERAKVFQYWQKPSGKHKDGKYSVMVNDKTIDLKDNPYSQYSHPYPFFKSCAIPIPGKIWGKCPVELLRKTQISYNYVYSILIQTLEKMGKLQWWIPKGSQVDKTAVNSKLGTINYYAAQPGQAPPSPVTPPSIPMYYFQILHELDKAFEDISGFHEVKASARLPTGAKNPSGVMVGLLLEQDENRLTPAVKEYLLSVKQEAKLYLEMAQDLYQESRILKIGGEEKEALIRDFMGAQLGGNNDVEVELAPIFTDSRAAWEQTVWNALDRQAIDARTAIRKLRLEHPKQLEDILAEERLAIRENNEMRQGTQRNVEDFHVDEVHMPIHETLMKTKTYENLDPRIQQIFMAHREQHLQKQAEKFQQRLKEQAQMQAAQGLVPQAAGGEGVM